MNVERLHNVFFQVKYDIDHTKLIQKIHGLAQGLSQLQNNINNPQIQQNVANLREDLLNTLSQHPSNKYPPSWKNLLRELNLDWFIAEDLYDEIEDAFVGNEIIPAETLKQINQIHSTLSGDYQAAEKLLSSFERLQIKKEELKAGESEVSVSIPPAKIESDLKLFGEEIIELEKIFNPFAELVTGSKQDLKIKTISSSDFVVTFFIAAKVITVAAGVVSAIALAVSAVIKAYKDVLTLRESKNLLSPFKGSKKIVDEIEDLARRNIRGEINKAAKQIVTKFTRTTKERRNELENALRINMLKLAERIDNGWKIETRMSEVKEPGKGAKSKPAQERRELYASYQIIEEAYKIQIFFKPKGEPILFLKEYEEGKKEEKKTDTKIKEKEKPTKKEKKS